MSINEVANPALAFRNGMTDRLVAGGMIRSAVLEAAFRAVPRELFTPAATPLDAVYDPDQSVITKTDAAGVALSSVSAPAIQALMIEQAEIATGMTVLEVGSGGYNAALLAEVTGPAGRVISLDIDQDVVSRAREALTAAGYGDRVRVVLGDAENGMPGLAPFDRIIVTAGAWEIPEAWPGQLTAEGRLVVPLRMNGITRTIAFRPEGDHQASTSAEVAGFVPMQGDGAHDERAFLLPTDQDGGVWLRFDQRIPAGLESLDGVMAAGRTVTWSSVTIGNQVSFADLHLWLASYLPGFCKIGTDPGIDLAPDGVRWFPFGTVHAGSFACLVTRRVADGAEFGALAYGSSRERAAALMNEQIQAWDRDARHGPSPAFAVWPAGTDPRRLPAGSVVIEKSHSIVTIAWPATARLTAPLAK